MLEDLSPPRSFASPPSSSSTKTDGLKVLERGYEEGEDRVKKGHHEAALKAFEYVLASCEKMRDASPTSQPPPKEEEGSAEGEALAVRCLVQISSIHGHLGDPVKQYKNLRDAAGRCGGGKEFGNVAGLWRRAGLMGLRVNDLKGARECFERALGVLGFKVGEGGTVGDEGGGEDGDEEDDVYEVRVQWRRAKQVAERVFPCSFFAVREGFLCSFPVLEGFPPFARLLVCRPLAFKFRMRDTNKSSQTRPSPLSFMRQRVFTPPPA
jgi:hypothetical protein